MDLTVVFETWMLGDGVYPPLERGQAINIALELQPESVRLSPPDLPLALEPRGPGEYRVVAEVLFSYLEPGERAPDVAISAGGLPMFISGATGFEPRVGTRIEAFGTLGFDHYSWSESTSRRSGAPDLFRPFHITRLRSVRIPERFIGRSRSGSSGPAHVPPEEWDPADVVDVVRMSDDSGEDYAFYLLDLNDSQLVGKSIPRTFIS